MTAPRTFSLQSTIYSDIKFEGRDAKGRPHRRSTDCRDVVDAEFREVTSPVQAEALRTYEGVARKPGEARLPGQIFHFQG